MSFSDDLKRAGLSRAELARRFGFHRQAVSAWGENPPRYAVEYVRLCIRLREIEECAGAARRGER